MDGVTWPAEHWPKNLAVPAGRRRQDVKTQLVGPQPVAPACV